MPGHPLISGYLRDLAGTLPRGAIEELADGLIESYEHQLAAGLAADAAARRAIAEFGDVRQVTAAFARQAPGRRTARILLATGPAVGGCWGVALLATHVWTWPIPLTARVAFAATLPLVVAVLATAATSRHSYRRTRLAALGGTGIVLLDLAMITAVLVAAPVFTGLIVIAVLASLARVGLTVRVLAR
jgi:hypothetical protein